MMQRVSKQWVEQGHLQFYNKDMNVREQLMSFGELQHLVICQNKYINFNRMTKFTRYFFIQIYLTNQAKVSTLSRFVFFSSTFQTSSVLLSPAKERH